MEKMVEANYLRSVFNGKRVFLTGHTGFKGSWMLQILHWLGANVKGYALAPEKDNDLYNQIEGDKLCYSSVIADICDLAKLKTEIVRFEPDFIFHLAAQPLVRRGYDQPAYTFLANTQGTAHVLEAMRCLAPDRVRGAKAASSSVSAIAISPNIALACAECTRPALTIAAGRCWVMSAPSKRTRPALTRKRPEMARSKVVLPWPFGPNRPIDSSRPTCSDRPRNTVMAP